ncbi:H-NS histone family protein [Bordetella genomosp. 11]|uniref:DNA-binding protein n=1 Tax=Bordetella genomosp. 11 TaxID=1416808 RepID=A0A261UIA7_9BORD|nr:H-NS histone family protein [Bordetella genomosp. 11]OZI61345.1 DNA-binding protein [Bordetella genomosp. 11]
MPRETYSAQQARIEKEIDKLRKKAEALQMKRRKPVVASIIRSMREYNITPEEIVAAFGKPAARRGPGRKTAGATAAASAKRAVAPKYRHPDTGETWTGRGKAPRWLTAAEAAGASRETFLIQ